MTTPLAVIQGKEEAALIPGVLDDLKVEMESQVKYEKNSINKKINLAKDKFVFLDDEKEKKSEH